MKGSQGGLREYETHTRQCWFIENRAESSVLIQTSREEGRLGGDRTHYSEFRGCTRVRNGENSLH